MPPFTGINPYSQQALHRAKQVRNRGRRMKTVKRVLVLVNSPETGDIELQRGDRTAEATGAQLHCGRRSGVRRPYREGSLPALKGLSRFCRGSVTMSRSARCPTRETRR